MNARKLTIEKRCISARGDAYRSHTVSHTYHVHYVVYDSVPVSDPVHAKHVVHLRRIAHEDVRQTQLRQRRTELIFVLIASSEGDHDLVFGRARQMFFEI